MCKDKNNAPSITKANALIQSSYALSLDEQRLVLLGISKINPMSDIFDAKKQTVTVTVEEFTQTFKTNGKSAYQQLRSAMERLWGREISIVDETTGKVETYRWIPKKVSYPVGEGKVSFRFDHEILPYLVNLREKFRSYQLNQIAEVRSVYTIRIYELLNQYLDTGWRIESVDGLRKMLKVEDKYPNYAHLRRWVLEPAKKEMEKKTNIAFEYEPIKSGRKVVNIRFNIREADQLTLDL